jgi:hypothetical protein
MPGGVVLPQLIGGLNPGGQIAKKMVHTRKWWWDWSTRSYVFGGGYWVIGLSPMIILLSPPSHTFPLPQLFYHTHSK